ncbi:MAG: hypothetical protein GY754_26390 [bacterium]|nr:hypothetical protein [bacterium]
MNTILAVIILIFSLIGWLGQLVSAFFPGAAVKLGLTEPKDEVDPAFYADVRGEAWWDTFSLWTLPVAGILSLLGNSLWVYFGLVGGGIYVYFAGRGIFTRTACMRKGIRIGKPESLAAAYVFLTLWGVAGAVSVYFAVRAMVMP